MRRHDLVALILVAGLCVLASASQAKDKVAVVYGGDDPKIAFCVGDIKDALKGAGHRVVAGNADIQIGFEIFELGMGPQSFRIRKEGDRAITIVGGDELGCMYGGLELAEQITLGGGLDAVKEMARKPYIFRRGLKYNIPFDARGPSYDDTGTAAQETIPVVWEFEFWEEFLNSLARNRYNVLTLWTCHPYPGLVKMEKYPDIGYDDVCVLKDGVDTKTDRHFNKLDMYDPSNFKTVKKITLDEKIDFWTRVFALAEARGIEIYVFHWNIYTFGAKGRHGIDDMPDNQKTIDYMRYCIGEFLKTYPQIDGIGVTAGEHVDRQRVKKVGGIEQWLWLTYGKGVMDAKAVDPDRELRFIFRQHQADLTKIAGAFDEINVPFNTGHKYARARIYSTSTSPYLDFEYRELLEEHKTPCWLNMRNDDIFIFRWGDADHVREFLQNVPRDLMRYEAGFYMGPDGYVWGRDFASKDAELAGISEIDKHWYRFMLWGRLGYDLTLTRDYFEQRLEQRFTRTPPADLYSTWAAASQVISLIDLFFFRINDFQFSPEGCVDKGGFLTIDNSFFKYPPLRGSGILSVQEYAEAVLAGNGFEGITPMDMADRLDACAAEAIEGVSALRRTDPGNKELAITLNDIEALALLGRYYADKIRGAAEVAVVRADPKRTKNHEAAVKHFENAVGEWEAYARVAAKNYHPQLFSRTHHIDWWKILEDVKKEAKTIKSDPSAAK